MDNIEQEIQAKGLNHLRVTPKDIQDEIVSEYYFTANQGAFQAWTDGDNSPREFEDVTALKLLTFCVLVLRNGFTVTGESSCVSPENFDEEIGRKVAREKAVDKIWPLLGFRLRDRIAG